MQTTQHTIPCMQHPATPHTTYFNMASICMLLLMKSTPPCTYLLLHMAASLSARYSCQWSAPGDHHSKHTHTISLTDDCLDFHKSKDCHGKQNRKGQFHKGGKYSWQENKVRAGEFNGRAWYICRGRLWNSSQLLRRKERALLPTTNHAF